MRASLLARAMASRLRCAKRLEAWWIQGQRARIAAAGRRSMTTWAACTKRVRRYLLPRLEILPSLVRSVARDSRIRGCRSPWSKRQLRQLRAANTVPLLGRRSADPEAIEDDLDAVDGDLCCLFRRHVFLRDVGLGLWP